ncbi:GPI ethanolamine phosphate transferase 1 [Ephemerocybe angulata]|uniref:GPI ethanolamine phosphate transferase 1 n=1 Tax=Ephemerocybe angulata TaxID=980116 RepID=A0A8H6HXM6_9AGAR|nr:GPI ethanolamine phosphate transferase 1 [Tulosesus angulatus]
MAKKATGKTMERLNVTKLLVLGLLFHVIFINSVFDCYFTSPVVSGMKRFSVGSAPAKRLVLIVGDGLRADLLLNLNAFPNIPGSPKVVAPYLRSIVEQRGAFGISHTRVPTESRPGHVAIIGGMYEDVSAVTKGWKVNPVDFDSVFNQSSSTYSFGSPDILPMFARGATPGKVKEWSYHEDDEDFTKDATALDIWVLDHLEELFRNATTNVKLNHELRQNKVVFFLHLLGLDTTGHSYRPHSKEYMNNIRVVDDIVQRAEALMTEFYGDDDTSFIFTADHGMSEIGNHGDGHPDNTRTPLIAWGKGVRGPLADADAASHDAYSEPWGLSHLYRRDVEQADIASVMAALIGIEWPVNSVGVLPDVDPSRPGYLDPATGEEGISRAALVNAKVILEQYRVKHELKKQHALLYKPFPALPEPTPGSSRLTSIESRIESGAWHAAKQEAAGLIRDGLAGLHYLQTYDRFLIRAIVTLAYTGWAAFASMYAFKFRPSAESESRRGWYANGVRVGAAVVLVGSWLAFAVQKSPWSFYVYVSFPVYFWREFLLRGAPELVSRVAARGSSLTIILLWAGFVIASTQAMVVGYTHRSIWSAGFLVMGFLWPLFWPRNMKQRAVIWVGWAALCSVNAIFPLLSVNKTESVITILAGGCAIWLLGWVGLLVVQSSVPSNPGQEAQLGLARQAFVVQSIFLAAAMAITQSSISHLRAKTGLPLSNQIAGWLVLGVSSAFPFTNILADPAPRVKILRYFMGFGPAFVILSISVEGLFYAAFSACLVTWIEVETRVRTAERGGIQAATVESWDVRKDDGKRVQPSLTDYRYQPSDARIAVMFLFFVQIAFFGTGNVASISSFYLSPVYRLIPIFNPFFMASLLIFKILAPYIMLGIAFSQLNRGLRLPPFSLLLVALTIVDGMTLTFFFKVQDTGSWLEIGQSITFFCIASLLLLWAAGVSAAGEMIMAGPSSGRRSKVD